MEEVLTSLALSTSAQHKSTPYPKVTTIIFDEFIIETGTIHYLKDEVKALPRFLLHGGQVSGPDTGTHAVQRHLHHEPVLHQMAHHTDAG